MTMLLHGDDPEFAEISPVIITRRRDELDDKTKRLLDALGQLGIVTIELEKLRIGVKGTAPAWRAATASMPADVVIIAKKHEVIRALAAARSAFNALHDAVGAVLNSASLCDGDVEHGFAGATRTSVPPPLRRRFPADTRGPFSRRRRSGRPHDGRY